MDSILVSASSIQELEASCPYCHEQLEVGDVVIQCPLCERWHHVACWRENGNGCSVHGCHGKGDVRDSAPQALPDGEIRIVETPAISLADQPIQSDQNLLDDIRIESLEPGPRATPWTETADVGAGIGNIEMISIDKWELALNKAIETTKLGSLLERVGLKGFLERSIKGEYYYATLGIVLLVALAITIALIIILLIVLSSL